MNEDLTKLLQGILLDVQRRVDLIKEFQTIIWNSSAERLNVSSHDFELLSGLAYDLDYYEPNPNLVGDDESFFGVERLEKEVESVLNKLRDTRQ